MRHSSVFVVLCTAGAVAASASAAVSFTYADPPSGLEVVYTAPTQPGDDGVVTIDTIVNLRVDLTDHGLGVFLFNDAHFVKNATVGPATQVDPGIFIADSNEGSFSFTTSGGDPILSGVYDGGKIIVIANSGSLTTNNSNPGGSLTLTYGAVLNALLDGTGLAFGDGIDSVWTMTAISHVGIGPDGYFEDFESNAAYTGTAQVVPTPGALALGAFSGLLCCTRRTRR